MTTGDFKDASLADRGKARIEWAAKEMPVLRLIRDRFTREQPLRACACQAACTSPPRRPILPSPSGGRRRSRALRLNPLSTQDDVAGCSRQRLWHPHLCHQG